jgi:hypothetical protein
MYGQPLRNAGSGKEVRTVTFGRRDIFEDVAATLLATATVMGFTATHQYWDVWLIGDSRRWTAGLLALLGVRCSGSSPGTSGGRCSPCSVA